MIVDAGSLPDNGTIKTDVCIVGAGIAGITLAREFIGEQFRVCLLECGGLGPDRDTQSLFWGENVGHPYFPLDISHSCGFGGTSNRWSIRLGDDRLGVRLRPLDEIDFEEREWVPHSGWPFQRSHLDPYYERAHSICQIGPYTYEVKDWADPERTPSLPLTNGRVKTTMFQFGPRDAFSRDYREEIERAENITTYIFANALEIETAGTSQSVSRILASTLQGRRFSVSAKLFVLAQGAIEIARLLLLSNKTWAGGLGNQNDLVGRFFMEHPHLWSGKLIAADPHALETTALYSLHVVNDSPIMGKLTLAEEVLRRERLLNYCVSIHPETRGRHNVSPSWPIVSWPLLSPRTAGALRSGEGKGGSAVSEGSGGIHGELRNDSSERMRRMIPPVQRAGASAYRRMRSGIGRVIHKVGNRKKEPVFRLNHMSEQAPNPNSRVTLADEVDVLGRRRARLDWQLCPLDVRSIIRAQEIIDDELRRAGLGRLQIELKDETPPPSLEGGWHHMGRTRMHGDPQKGVVDENCKVHGISNLYVAGPSVFPTGGYANPVLTIVALATRLGDHLKRFFP